MLYHDSLILRDIQKAREKNEYEWKNINVGDLYGLLLIYHQRMNNKPFYTVISTESPNKERQRELLQIIEILLIAEPSNVRGFARQLQQFLPNNSNSIQPLYNPTDESDDKALLKVEIDTSINLILREKTYLLELPTEI